MQNLIDLSLAILGTAIVAMVPAGLMMVAHALIESYGWLAPAAVFVIVFIIVGVLICGPCVRPLIPRR